MDAAAAEAALRARLGFDLEPRLRQIAADFAGLLDRPTMVLLLADEEGLLPKAPPLPDLEPSGGLQEVAGTLERLVPTRTFRRSDGSVGFVCDADVRTREGLQRVVLWDDAVRGIQGWMGRPVKLTALVAKSRNGARELHSTRATWVGAP